MKQSLIEPTARYCDTHFHLDLCDNPSEVTKAIEANNLTVFAMTNAPFVFRASLELAQSSRRICVGLGMHPQLIARCADQMSLFRSEASRTQLIGEVGLDYQTESIDDRCLQRRIFGEILAECDADGNKVISIHSRRATSDVIAMIAGVNSTCILHWFSGTMRELDQAEEAGAYFSVNPSMLVTKTGRRLVARMRRDRVLTETDGPYVRVHNRPAGPTDVVSVVEGLADLWGEDREMVSDVIMENLTGALSSGRRNGAG